MLKFPLINIYGANYQQLQSVNHEINYQYNSGIRHH